MDDSRFASPTPTRNTAAAASPPHTGGERSRTREEELEERLEAAQTICRQLEEALAETEQSLTAAQHESARIAAGVTSLAGLGGAVVLTEEDAASSVSTRMRPRRTTATTVHLN